MKWTQLKFEFVFKALKKLSTCHKKITDKFLYVKDIIALEDKKIAEKQKQYDKQLKEFKTFLNKIETGYKNMTKVFNHMQHA